MTYRPEIFCIALHISSLSPNRAHRQASHAADHEVCPPSLFFFQINVALADAYNAFTSAEMTECTVVSQCTSILLACVAAVQFTDTQTDTAQEVRLWCDMYCASLQSASLSLFQ